MRIRFVVQRYGPEVAGGAETHCRMFAERLAGLGHTVEVVTTTARSYVDWADELPAGRSREGGVDVLRLAVAAPRDPAVFGPVQRRMMSHTATPPGYLSDEWIRLQGPWVPGLADAVTADAAAVDVVVCFTYLYWTTVTALQACAGRIPTVLHATAHDERPFWTPAFSEVLRLPSAYAFSVEEEADLVARRLGRRHPGATVGIGVDLDVTADPDAFRETHGLGDRPYLVYVGRVDPSKGALELHEMFRTFRQRDHRDLALVIVGEQVTDLPGHPDVIVTGFVDDATRASAMAGAVALVQPSYFESFSMVLAEAWALGVPALVQERCAVLTGQCLRSGGGIPYAGYGRFEAAVQWLLDHPGAARRMGRRGRAYVEHRYRWDRVMDRYQDLLGRTARTGPGLARPLLRRPPLPLVGR